MPILISLLLGNIVIAQSIDNKNIDITGEYVMIIESTGTNYISFITIRTPFDNIGWSVDKVIKLDEFLNNFLYLNPIDYTWDDSSSSLYNYFTFAKGSYGTIIKGNFESGISVKNNETFEIKDGIYSYKNEDGVKEFNGGYGISYEKYGFTQLTYVWILPDDWEFAKYSSESSGKWLLRKNTLIYTGKNVNNVVFNIEYRRKNFQKIAKIKKSLDSSNEENVQIEEVDNGLKLIFSDQIFFSSGKTKLNTKGKTVLDKVAKLMKSNPDFNLEIHGHTDNIKIKGGDKRIKNNWELSIFRSLSILNYLSKEKEIPGKRFEIRGYGEYRPIAPNSTAEGRSKNRRIEFFLKEFK